MCLCVETAVTVLFTKLLLLNAMQRSAPKITLELPNSSDLGQFEGLRNIGVLSDDNSIAAAALETLFHRSSNSKAFSPSLDSILKRKSHDVNHVDRRIVVGPFTGNNSVDLQHIELYGLTYAMMIGVRVLVL